MTTTTTTTTNNSPISFEETDLYSPQPSNSGVFTRWVKGVKGALRNGKKRKSPKSKESFNLNSNKSDDSIIMDNDCWVDEEILNKDEVITPDINSALFVEMRSDIYEISAVISNSLPDKKDQQQSQPIDSDQDSHFLENTGIIEGSVEHFAFVRTLRKLRVRKDRQRPIHQVLLLNKVLSKLSSQTSDEVHDELIRFKSRVYELNRIKRTNNNANKKNKKNGRSSSLSSSSLSSSASSASSLHPSSMMNKRLSAILAEIHPVSPITMQYRPSYASSKVVTVFDEESNQLVIKELPMARRRRRLSDLSNILARSTSSSSTSSTNSSQSSLVTLTDDVEQNKYSSFTTKEPDTYLPNIVVRQNNDEDGDEEDHVPLFVLKEQFKYSGRGYALIKSTESVALAV